MRGCGACQHKAWDIFCERGGGSKPSPPTVIQTPPPQVTSVPQPNVQQNAADLFQAQLQYNPQLTQQAVQLQQQYAPLLAALQSQLQEQFGPKLAQQEFALQEQFVPQYRRLYEQQFPAQTQALQTLAEQSGQRLTNPQALTPEQQAAQDAIRQRAREQVSRNIRTEANLGGGLFGGRRELREDRSLGELEQGFVTEDINRQMAQRDQLLRELIASQQVLFPQIQQPGVPAQGVPQFGQGVTPSADNLLAAIQGGYIVNPATVVGGTAGTPGSGGQYASAAATIAIKVITKCLPPDAPIDTEHGTQPVQSVEAGEVLSDGSRVMFKSAYAPDLTTFVRLDFEDGTYIEACDWHALAGKTFLDTECENVLDGKRVVTKTVRHVVTTTYDLLTTAEDGGYPSNGVHIPSMIPTLHKLANQLEAMRCLS